MDNLTPEQRRRNMQNIRSAGTRPERLIASELRKRNVYFAKNVKTITGKPDFAFRRKRIVVFIDSDFWHGHPKRCVMPKSNYDYWNIKITNNRKRDKLVTKMLKNDGWKVIRLWEHDIKKNLAGCVDIILDAIEESHWRRD